MKAIRYAKKSHGGQPNRLDRGRRFVGKRWLDGTMQTLVDRNADEEAPWQECAQYRGVWAALEERFVASILGHVEGRPPLPGGRHMVRDDRKN